jgi:hypothetical protein
VGDAKPNVTWRERLTLTSGTKRTLWRCGSVLLLSIVGATVFEVALAFGWRYAKLLPEPTRWFRAWFVYVAVYYGLLAVAFIAVEPIRFRTRHIRHLHRYPPLWMSIVLGVAIAGLVESLSPPARSTLLPQWRQLDIIAPLIVAAIVAVAFRQLPWRWTTPDDKRAPIVAAPLTWDVLEEWVRREEPLTHGPDLLGHEPIVDRIARALIQNVNHSIALIGPIGSGKSSILNAVKRKIDKTVAPFTIVAEFNCWAMPRPEDAPRVALQRAIDALDGVIDAQAVRRLPATYQRVLAAEPTGKLSKLLGLDDVPDAAEHLRALSPLLTAIDARLLLVIEDAERAGNTFETRPLERLLWTLRNVDRISFILSFDAQQAHFDYSKLCDTIERVPQVTADRVEDILAPAYAYWIAIPEGSIDPMSEPRKDLLGLDNVTDPTLRYMRRTRGDTVSDAVTGLLTSPRDLKHFMRDVDRAWNNLRGEVELNDLIVLTALRHGAPAVFDFVVENADAARSEKKPDDMFAGDAVKTVKKRWEALRDSLSAPGHLQTLVDVLNLPQLRSHGFSTQSSPQGIYNDHPTDYLARILGGQLLPGEIRDQDVLRDIDAWKSSRSGRMIGNLKAATSDEDQYKKVWEHYAARRLSDDELIDVAHTMISDLLARDGADATINHPAMLAVWRRSIRRFNRDSRTEWLADQIRSALPISLGFATDLFNYFGSTKHGIVGYEHRAQLRAAVVDCARATFTDASSLLATLGTVNDYPLTRLIFPPPTDEPPDTVGLDEWAWLVPIIIDAARVNPDRVLSDVAVLVGDTIHGFRTGQFQQRYKLKRDWLTKIFGDRSDDVIALLANYQGSHEWAREAKQEAQTWLSERSAPSKP